MHAHRRFELLPSSNVSITWGARTHSSLNGGSRVPQLGSRRPPFQARSTPNRAIQSIPSTVSLTIIQVFSGYPLEQARRKLALTGRVSPFSSRSRRKEVIQ